MQKKPTERDVQNLTELAKTVGSFLVYVDRYDGYDEPQIVELLNAYAKVGKLPRSPKGQVWGGTL